VKILVIEDDKDTVEILRLTLEVYNPNATIVSSEKGYEGLEFARSTQLDLVLLDLGLPDIDGIEVLKELRKFCKTPVLVISARHDPEVIINALVLGAEDYILKPFSLQMILNRLQDFSDKPGPKKLKDEPGRITKDLSIFKESQRVILKGDEIQLTRDEWKILNSLVEHRGRIVTIRELVQILSQEGDAGESHVHQVVNQLVKKIGDNPDLPNIIVSEYDCGYRLVKTIDAS
jgi:two-component system, OmpR family, KDP operon response regulator KdpE